MNYLAIKALHIIFVVTWFAGLFYMFRLFVYYAEAGKKGETASTILRDQFKIMMKRLWYIIAWPSAILTLIFGLWMIALNHSLLYQSYMQIKLVFVALLIVYQFYGESHLRQVLAGKKLLSSMRYRFLNEVPTVILIAVVFLIVLKSSLGWIWGTVGILGVAILLTLAIKLYKKSRDRS